MARHQSHRHPITGTVHPHHPPHVYAHDAVMEHEANIVRERHSHEEHHGPSFRHHSDPPNPLPHERDANYARREQVIERGRSSHPSYVRSYVEHGRRLGLPKR
jgi:hypothetical protein